MSLITQFDKKYSFLGLIGLGNPDNKGKKAKKLSVSSDKNPMSFIKNNHIDYFSSLHTK